MFFLNKGTEIEHQVQSSKRQKRKGWRVRSGKPQKDGGEKRESALKSSI